MGPPPPCTVPARCWYLVGGSTVGLLAGIRAAAPFGSEVLVARNCHKAVYHAIELGHLTAHYLVPPVVAEFGVTAASPPKPSAAALSPPAGALRHPDQPYLRGGAERPQDHRRPLHARGVPLLVDEAHGAHYLPWLPLRLAEAVAAGGLGGAKRPQDAAQPDPDRVAAPERHPGRPRCRGTGAGRVRRPVLPAIPVASLDGCTGWLAEPGRAAFAAWRARLDGFTPPPALGAIPPCWGWGPSGGTFTPLTMARSCCASARRALGPSGRRF